VAGALERIRTSAPMMTAPVGSASVAEDSVVSTDWAEATIAEIVKAARTKLFIHQPRQIRHNPTVNPDTRRVVVRFGFPQGCAEG
jgi:hypothetical protein